MIVNTSSYTYDGEGRRTQIGNSDGTSHVQVYNRAGQMMYARATGGTPSTTKYIYMGTQLIAEVDSVKGVTYTHADALGSPVARTNSSAAVLSRTRFEPYGNVAAGFTPTRPNSIGFTGHVHDANTGLTYMQQRYYDPIAGRFLSVDPVVTDANTGKMFGRYTYVDNNPYAKVDPDGRDAMDWVHGALTVASFCPSLCGSSFSAIDGLVSYAQGDKAAAGISFAAAAGGIVSDAGAIKAAGMAAKEVATSGKALQLAKNVEQGAKAEAAAAAKLGDQVAGRRVTLEASTGQRSVADLVTNNGGVGVVEVKSGKAGLSPGQEAIKADQAAGRTVTPRGQNAANAGLTPGQPVKLNSYVVDRY